MRRVFLAALGFLSFLIVAGALALAGGYYWLVTEFKKPGPLPQSIEFVVESGASGAKVAADLRQAGALDEPRVMTWGARLLGVQGAIKAGEYALEPHMSAEQILALLHSGKVIQRQFTIPEGLTSYEIVQIVRGVPALSGEIVRVPAEGTLLPETYSFAKGETRTAKIEQMQTAMQDVLNDLWPKRVADLPFQTLEQALVLASIVEKETGVPSERRRVAGVFVNRLRAGIALQTDPSVIYALTGGKPESKGLGPLGRRLLKKDLEIDSPYNTYRYAGLPPGPICNPGKASIEAALNPEAHKYLYFVADGTGGHVFAETLEEHNKNVARWRAVRRQQDKKSAP